MFSEQVYDGPLCSSDFTGSCDVMFSVKMEWDLEDCMFIEVFATVLFVFPTNIILVAVSSVGAGWPVGMW